MWALGVTAYQLLCGRLPFASEEQQLQEGAGPCFQEVMIYVLCTAVGGRAALPGEVMIYVLCCRGQGTVTLPPASPSTPLSHSPLPSPPD